MFRACRGEVETAPDVHGENAAMGVYTGGLELFVVSTEVRAKDDAIVPTGVLCSFSAHLITVRDGEFAAEGYPDS